LVLIAVEYVCRKGGSRGFLPAGTGAAATGFAIGLAAFGFNARDREVWNWRIVCLDIEGEVNRCDICSKGICALAQVPNLEIIVVEEGKFPQLPKSMLRLCECISQRWFQLC
jgi:hypothetical protein